MIHDKPDSGSRLCRLHQLGQAVWLDDISRTILTDGTLQRLIDDDCLSGLTSNPVIFEQAIRGSSVYDAAMVALAAGGLAVPAIYETLAIEDVGRAADLFLPKYRLSGGEHGYACLEVSPRLARNTEGTVDEARRLWSELARPNVMIKVPGTQEGLPAIRRLIAEGININVTLLFSPSRYAEVAEAYLAGLERRLAEGNAAPHPQSVASFFLSRIDTLVDRLLDRRPESEAVRLRGETAIAVAGVAMRHYRAVVASDRWRRLAAAGAFPQRLLWASTATKDPAYSDVKYVEALAGPDTVITMPAKTIAAFRDHGIVARESVVDRAGDEAVLRSRLAALDIDLEVVATELETEGIDKFAQGFDALHGTIAARVAGAASAVPAQRR